MTFLAQPSAAIGSILIALAVIALIEHIIPLRCGGRFGHAHLWPNLALTFIAFITNTFLNVTLIAGLTLASRFGLGILNALRPAPLVAGAAAVLGLDFSFYVAHVAMHKIPSFWRCHLVHHCDPFVDVTTTIRQHPGESVIRYTFLAAFALALGASPAAFAVYRMLSALNGLLEHANVRIPARLDGLLALVTTWPSLHKVHHSRAAVETDSNYGNLFSFWDRLFSTFTASGRRIDIQYGLDGFDDIATHTTRGLLALPFRPPGVQQQRAGSRPR